MGPLLLFSLNACDTLPFSLGFLRVLLSRVICGKRRMELVYELRFGVTKFIRHRVSMRTKRQVTRFLGYFSFYFSEKNSFFLFVKRYIVVYIIHRFHYMNEDDENGHQIIRAKDNISNSKNFLFFL